jgi:integrase
MPDRAAQKPLIERHHTSGIEKLFQGAIVFSQRVEAWADGTGFADGLDARIISIQKTMAGMPAGDFSPRLQYFVGIEVTGVIAESVPKLPLITIMIYTFARVGAVLQMNVSDYFSQGRRGWVRLHEKGGKEHEAPCIPKLEAYLDE